MKTIYLLSAKRLLIFGLVTLFSISNTTLFAQSQPTIIDTATQIQSILKYAERSDSTTVIIEVISTESCIKCGIMFGQLIDSTRKADHCSMGGFILGERKRLLSIVKSQRQDLDFHILLSPEQQRKLMIPFDCKYIILNAKKNYLNFCRITQ